MSDIRTQAVIVVDVQADFTQYRNGALAVPGTGPDYLEQGSPHSEFGEDGLPVLATRDMIRRIMFPLRVIQERNLRRSKLDHESIWPPHRVKGLQAWFLCRRT
jgi:nicotinamidase-related amidase